MKKTISIFLCACIIIISSYLPVFAVQTDTTGPVITVVSCDKSGQVLYEGDSITLVFSIEDPSGIGSKGMLMTYTDPDGKNYREFSGPSCALNEETGLYECKFTVTSSHKVGKYKFAKLHAYDGVGNYSYIRPSNSFSVAGTESDFSGPVITEVSCDKENETLYEGDTITYFFKLEDPSGIGSKGMLMTYRDSDGNNYREFSGPACILNAETGLYECKFTVTASHKVGMYEFAKLHAYDTKGNSSYINPDRYFYVADTETDTSGPVISEVACDNENEILYEGDSITYIFSLEDPSGIASKGMLMTYRNLDGEGYTEFLGPPCILNETTGFYECTFIIDSSHKVGIYEFAKLHAYDGKNNESYINPDVVFTVHDGERPTNYGDINSDGEVNNLDRLCLTRYLADWSGYDEELINREASDLNMDGYVNNLDRLIITRHLANWEGYEELPVN